MICPKCKNNVPEDSLVCPACSLKLKTVCPKCKQLNILGSEFCSGCGLRLLKFCQQCNAANVPVAKECRKCHFVFESVIKENVQPQLEQLLSENKESDKKVLLVAELVNWQDIQEQFENTGFYKKLLAKFYQIFAKQAKINQIKAKKLETTILSLDWDDESLYASATMGAATALNIMSELDLFNEQLFEKMGCALNIRLFLCPKEEIKSDENIIRRHFSKENEITVSKTLCYMLQDIFEFEISPFEVENNTYNNFILTDLKKETRELIEEDPEFAQEKAELEVEEPEILLSQPEVDIELSSSAEPVNAEEAEETEVVEETQAQEVFEEQEFFADEQEQEIEKDIEADNIEQIEQQQQDIIEEEPFVEILPQEEKDYTREEIFNEINNAIQHENASVFGIAGTEGMGKTSLINSINSFNQDKNYLWLWGQCSPNVQITPLGLFRDVFKNLFGLPVFITDYKNTEKHLFEMLSKNLQITDKFLIKSIVDLVLSSEKARFEDILRHKENTINTIIEFLDILSLNNKLILVIDDVDYIDGFSFEILNNIVKSKIFDADFKLILTFQKDKKLGSFLISDKIDATNSKTYDLPPISPDEVEQTLIKFINNQDILPENIKNQIVEKSQGVPLYVEEATLYLMQREFIFMKNNELQISEDIDEVVFPEDLHSLVEARINDFEINSKEIFKMISMISLFGPIFMPSMVKDLAGMGDSEFAKILEEIGYNGIFKMLGNNNFGFKNFLLWEVCYKKAQESSDIEKLNEKILKILKKQVEFDSSIKALKAEAVGSIEEAVEFWAKSSFEAIFLGDTNIFTISQKQLLKVLEKSSLSNRDELKIQIYENLGKLNYERYPDESIEFLSNAIVAEQDKKQTIKVVDLSGYLAKSCMLKGNYTGAIECTDKALSLLNKESSPLEHALLCYTKLKPLFELGNLEEAVNTAQHDVIAVFNDVLNGKLKQNLLSLEEIETLLAKSELILAKSLAAQGKEVYLQITAPLLAKAKQSGNKNIETQCHLINAFFKAIQGNYKEVVAISNSIKAAVSPNELTPEATILWDFIKVLNCILNGDIINIREDLFKLATFAHNHNEENFKNLVKTLLGKTMVVEGQSDKALFVYNDQIDYFSKNKMATGAMLGWYLISELMLYKSDFDNGLQISEKAFDVSKNPKINNYLFMSLFKKLIAESYLLKGDYTATKMHAEEGLVFARQFNLLMTQVDLYMVLARAYQESAAKDTEKEVMTNKLSNAHENYISALNIAQNIENDYLIAKVEKELQALSTFCQLSGIQI